MSARSADSASSQQVADGLAQRQLGEAHLGRRLSERHLHGLPLGLGDAEADP